MANVSVAIVTGANDIFTLDDAAIPEHGLKPWGRSLLARTADSPEIVFQNADHAAVLAAGEKGWLLDFSASKPDPAEERRPAQYLLDGESQGLHKRYKTSIRDRRFSG